MERIDAPLGLIVLADLAPQSTSAGRPYEVEKAGLDALLKSLRPTLRLGGAEIAFESPRDFRPEALADRLPEALALRQLRAVLDEAARGQRTRADVQEQLAHSTAPREVIHALREALEEERDSPTDAAPTPPPEAPPPSAAARAGGDAIDSLLSMVDVPGSTADDDTAPPAQASRALDHLMKDLLGPRPKRPPAGGDWPRLARAVDAALEATLRRALEDPEFSELEAAWLGLRFLVRRIDTRTGIRIRVIPTPKGERLHAVQDLALPVARAFREEGRTPVLLLDSDFGIELTDLAELAEIAEAAAREELPVIACASPSLLGLESWALLERAGNVGEILGDSDHVAWRVVRALESARWVALTVNRFRVRPWYGQQGDTVKGFPFEEIAVQEGSGELIAAPRAGLGRAVWAVAERIAASFARTGWGVELTGQLEAGRIEDLPVQPLRLRTGEVVQSSLETLPSEHRVLELAEAGLLALAAKRNLDQAFLLHAPAVRGSEGVDGASRRDEARRATLPYALMLAQITTILESVLPYVDPGKPAAEIARTVAASLEILTHGASGPLFEITLRTPTGAANTETISLGISPCGGPVRGLPDLDLELPIPGRSLE